MHMGEYFIQNLKFLRIFILYLLVGPHGTDSQNSYREGVHHYLVISLDLTQLSLHIKPCGCRRTFTQEGIRVQAGGDCQVVPGKHGPLRFQMILECHRALTGMPPFVVAMKEERYGH